MAANLKAYQQVLEACTPKNATLVVVSKNRSLEEIQPFYDAQHRDFGENRVQSLIQKAEAMPPDIRWHLIGHLQSNKIRQAVKYAYCIQSVDDAQKLQLIEKEAARIHKKQRILIQIHIAQEEHKFGWNMEEWLSFAKTIQVNSYPHLVFCGFMGMATFTDHLKQIQDEFLALKNGMDQSRELLPFFDEFQTLSMGMSGDYKLALEAGSNMVRVGSILFNPI